MSIIINTSNCEVTSDCLSSFDSKVDERITLQKTVPNGLAALDGNGKIITSQLNPVLVIGPPSATDNALCKFNATNGKLIQNSTVLLDDSSNMTGLSSVDSSSYLLNGNPVPVSSDGVYTGFVTYQGSHTESPSQSVYALKVNKMVTLSFPAINVAVTPADNTPFHSYKLPTNLLPDGEYVFPVFTTTQPACVKMVTSAGVCHLSFSTLPLVNWPTSTVSVNPFSVTYSCTNSDVVSPTGSWGGKIV
jgi:hypothetical protein